MSIKTQEFAIIRGNSGTEHDKIGITVCIENAADDTPVDLTGRTYTFSTDDGKLDKSMTNGIEILDNVVRIAFTKADSLIYPVGHVIEYQLEEFSDSYERTILKGRILIKEGGSFNDR